MGMKTREPAYAETKVCLLAILELSTQSGLPLPVTAHVVRRYLGDRPIAKQRLNLTHRLLMLNMTSYAYDSIAGGVTASHVAQYLPTVNGGHSLLGPNDFTPQRLFRPQQFIDEHPHPLLWQIQIHIDLFKDNVALLLHL